MKLEIGTDQLFLDGNEFRLLSGEFHYFRTRRDGWKRRLDLMKDFGLNAIQVYVPWNLHEPKKGQFCFDGECDLSFLLRLAQETGLFVLLRPSPYICAEWDFGGLPAWLLKDRTLCIRSSDPVFMEHLTSYYQRLAKEFVPFLSTSGGPILAVAVENEFGSFGNDKVYLKQIAELLTELGVDVPFFSAGGPDAFKCLNGSLPDFWKGVDFGANAKKNLQILKNNQPDKPLYAAELWTGRMIHWEDTCDPVPLEKFTVPFEETLESGASLNCYMFCGGSNFGFYNGANCMAPVKDYGKPLRREQYLADAQSYDYYAPVSEQGTPTPAYFAMRNILDHFLGKPERPDVAPSYETQVCTALLEEQGSFLGNIQNLAEKQVTRPNVVPMEDLDQSFGFILYSTMLDDTDDFLRHLVIHGLKDRACVFVDGVFLGAVMRDRENPDITFSVKKGGSRLDILVENMGRINYGYQMISEHKGIDGFVSMQLETEPGVFMYNHALIQTWTISTLPLEHPEQVDYTVRETQPGNPVFLKGHFQAKPGVDTFFDAAGFQKGNLWINGFHLGRFWSNGPQRTIYVPGDLLKDENELVLLELHPTGNRKVTFLDHPLLNEPLREIKGTPSNLVPLQGDVEDRV